MQPTKIIYAVGPKHGVGRHDDGLVYATVERQGKQHVSYEITSRLGDCIHVGEDAIDCLIAALIALRKANP